MPQTALKSPPANLASAEEIIEEARNGRMFILVDDENRENEGDLIIPAQMATPESIAFMAKEGRGLICLAMEGVMIDRLALPMMGQQQSRMQTAFTISIEAREGVTTGISAADRARTIQMAIAPNAQPQDLVSPGHVFPLRAREGGVLVRGGHTEAAVDVARMAGLSAAGVICEIMKDDGTMARLSDLIPFANNHGLKIGTIADLISFRRAHEKFIEQIFELTEFPSRWGNCQIRIFRNRIDGCEHMALVFGSLTTSSSMFSTPIPVRVHVENTISDVFSTKHCMIDRAIQRIQSYGQGVFVLIRDQNKSICPDSPTKLHEYGIGSQILSMIGVQNMIVLTGHPEQISDVKGLDAYGLTIKTIEGI